MNRRSGGRLPLASPLLLATITSAMLLRSPRSKPIQSEFLWLVFVCSCSVGSFASSCSYVVSCLRHTDLPVSAKTNLAANMRLSRFVEFGRKIICVGRNYREHAEELGHAVPKEPLLFMKPPSAYITEGQSIVLPRGCEELDHEVELGVVVGRRGSAIRAEEAMDYVAGYVVALDMTDRQLQRQCQTQGHPWERAKGFDTSCPVGHFLPRESVADPHALTLWCTVNGQPRQRSSTAHMLFNIPQLLEAASVRFTLEPGDLLLTGTPSGVGPVKAGDVIEAGIEGHGQVRFPVENAKAQ